MFEGSRLPRVYGVPPGVDFAATLAQGLLARLGGAPPEDMARITILVNSRRMQRRLRQALSDGTARLLPRVLLVTEMDELVPEAALPDAAPDLTRLLDLSELIEALLDADPSLAPQSARFDFAESLDALLEEMHGEAVDPCVITNLNTSDLSGHWERSRGFLQIVETYARSARREIQSSEARRRAATEALIRKWERSPPEAPVILAGSTGSRATTAELMRAVARLDSGAVLLPGFDFTTPASAWERLTEGDGLEDHPQFRFARFLENLDIAKEDVARWTDENGDIERNTLISLSLRPAPVTDQWMVEGRRFKDLRTTVKDLSLIQAPNPRYEAQAIAVALRDAVRDGKTAALITPDRTLGRRVAAALLRWDIVADDSAGRPLGQTAPGRFLRQVSALIAGEISAEALIALLKHPIANSGDIRGEHLNFTREFELYLRRKKLASVGPGALSGFAKTSSSTNRRAWGDWVAALLSELQRPVQATFTACATRHLALAEAIARGPDDLGAGKLWEEAAGREAKAVMEALAEQASEAQRLDFSDYQRLSDRVLAAANARSTDSARPDVMIWGTLEARVQGADLVILGGLNEGVWPARPDPDPWLNRRMRREAGLLSPERQTGLSAHDYQQAVGANSVILSRARKDEEAETVPSRWLNRLTNLLNGLPEQYGPDALKSMKREGDRLLAAAEALDLPAKTVDRAQRPAPVPPVEARPKVYSVTDIERLIRDPYAIYAKRVLGLRRLDPLRPKPTAAFKGEVFHLIMKAALEAGPYSDAADIENSLLLQANRILSQIVPWPATQRHWMGHIETIAQDFSKQEMARERRASPFAFEVKGRMPIDGLPVEIIGTADRLDRARDGSLVIYDYKTGAPPKMPQVRHFHKQLLIEAVMAERGSFEGIRGAHVSRVGYIGLDRALISYDIPTEKSDEGDFRTGAISGELAALIRAYHQETQPFPSRRAMEKVRWEGDYDHLARFGEWDDSQDAVVVRLT
ncbi:MAG: double-strand break repair protein AddB [Paracoccaceae bacterium]|nr:double-strand break repair protein AddB [Paracoccaceae bacterium]